MAKQQDEQLWELGMRIEALKEVADAIGQDDDQPLGRALLHLVARVQEGFDDIAPSIRMIPAKASPNIASLSTESCG